LGLSAGNRRGLHLPGNSLSGIALAFLTQHFDTLLDFSNMSVVDMILMFPDFLDFKCDEMHVEMASREFAEIELISQIASRTDVAVGIVDVKSYYIETPQDIANRVRLCLRHAPADRLVFAPDCGLSQTARWAAKRKLANMVEGVRMVKRELKIPF